ncbi:MAG: DNA repair protein RecN [Oscillibacter sp.]|nr:DNA repair protein RecN [Oscillibacter sp.]
MLELLHIENIAVIEEADIQFRPGFNALTGETGAGKSIVIDAMGAVLGGRTSRDLIRTGAAKAFVSAEFSGVPADLPGLAENGFAPDEDGNLLLQREISGDGKNACRINGRPLTVAQLRQIGGELLNIHGQHDGTQLLDEEQHGAYLDRFGRTESPFTAYRNAYTAMTDLRNQINALQMDEAEKARRVDSLRFQIDELERAELQPGEEEELEARRNLLRNGEKYLAALTGADYCLNGDDDSAGAVGQLGDAEASLAGIRTLDNEVLEVYNRLGALQSEAYDLAETVRDLRSAFDFSPEELDAAESRADQLYRLKKKYGATVQDMLDYLDKCQKELDAIETADDTLIQLEQKLKKARKEVLTAGKSLTEARKKAASELEARIQKELRDLDMNRVRFAISFAEKEPSPDGCDMIRFLMSANAGEDLKPIAKIASGGELARIMLALKNVLAEQESIGTLVFDEVDTGVSGRAAQKVAEKLAQVSRRKQVLCVTHLPQLAAMADTHYSVEKGERKGRTFTQVVLLSRERRKEELARITGGSKVTDALLESAGELLDAASSYRETLDGVNAKK